MCLAMAYGRAFFSADGVSEQFHINQFATLFGCPCLIFKSQVKKAIINLG